jgi:hypothetical protein
MRGHVLAGYIKSKGTKKKMAGENAGRDFEEVDFA